MHILDTAVASLKGRKVAEAKAIRIIDKDQIEVRETCFTAGGRVIYDGTVMIYLGPDCGSVRHPAPGPDYSPPYKEWRTVSWPEGSSLYTTPKFALPPAAGSAVEIALLVQRDRDLLRRKSVQARPFR